MTAVTVHALPAKCGDCLIIEYGANGSRPYRILIDGGLKGSYDEGLGKYLAESADQPTEFDIVVVTHIDLDHIEGVIEAIEQNQLTTDHIWFNGRDQLDELINADAAKRGARQGDALDKLIPAGKRNPAVGGKAFVVPESGVFEIPGMPGGATCTLLSPSRDRLERLLKKWPEPTRGDPLKDLFDAFEDDVDGDSGTRAAGVFGKDGSPANGSSIAFLLEVGETKLLLTGDAYAKELQATIGQVLAQRGEDKLAVDLFKLSHHGSRQNMTDSLLELIDPEQILVCTDGSKFKHPDADALQKIRTHYPNVPIQFTDNTDIIVERAGSIGLTAPTADQLPVQLHFGSASSATSASNTLEKSSKKSATKTAAKSGDTSASAAGDGTATSRVPANAPSGRTKHIHEGTNGVKIRGENLNVKLEWDTSAETRGGTADLSPKLAMHESSDHGAFSFEVVAEASVNEIEQTHSTSRGGTVGGAGELVVELGQQSDDEQRVVLIEENGQYGWFVPDVGTDTVALAATLGAPNSRGRITNLVRRKLRVIAIKGLHKAVGAATAASVGAYERRHHPPALRNWSAANYRTRQAGPPDLTGFTRADRGLLVIHGFMGSIHGSFNFESETVSRFGAEYGGRMIAYDHPTLTPTPRQNAEDLFDRLGGSELSLDILAHSRGGLVAREFARLSEGTKIDVRSIVFVASPNGGTPMADPDRPSGLLDGVTNFIGNIPGTDGFALVLELLADVVLKGALPGLGGLMAMQPAGEYLTELNQLPMPQHIVLRSIASEYEPAATAGFLQAKLDDALDAYFGQLRNDRIVPTASAYARVGNFQVQPGQRLVLDASRGVNHSTFWTDERATRQLLAWLSADEEARTTPEIPEAETDPEAEIAHVAETTSVASIIEGVKSLPATIRQKIESMSAGVAMPATPPTGQRDAVIVLPGIMGSHLAVDGRTIWVDALRLTRGGLSELEYGGGRSVSPIGLNRTYVPLVTQLARNWDVHLFPYDWRDDIFRSAKRLDELVTALRAQHPGRGVNFVAHSMGGLVVRAFVANHRERWADLGAVPGASSGRLVMLGTPNRGSYSVPMTLLGSELAVRGLAAVDQRNSDDRVAEIVAGFPGLYQMLPYAKDVEDDWLRLYDKTAWGERAHVRADLLQLGHETHEQLSDKGVDAARFCYVAGYGKDTPFRVTIDDGKDMRIGQFAMGDGRVAHRLGELDDMSMFFVDATHGGMISDPTVLDKLDDLIRDGSSELTELFLGEAPSRRGVEDEFVPMHDIDDIDPLPLEHATRTRGDAVRPPISADRRILDNALSMLLGEDLGVALGNVTPSRPLLKVKVVHGSLEQTRNPVAVGHYARMPAEGAEGFLDWKLGGVLEARYRLGLNADEPGRAMVVRASEGHFPGGAVVVGLGDFGQLTESILAEGITDGVLRLARMRVEAGIDTTAPFGLASVLIGTPGRFGLSIETSLQAIVEGVIRALLQLGEDWPHQFDLEFIDHYEQHADDVAKVLCRMRKEIDSGLLDAIDLDISQEVEKRAGGRPGAPSQSTSGRGPWVRMQAALEPMESSGDQRDTSKTSPIRKISVSVLTRQAQADRIVHEVDYDKISDYVDAAIGGAGPDSVGQTLYELLLPHLVKLDLSRSENIHLLVDKHLGQLPWELLTARDAGGTARGALALRAGFLRQLHSEETKRQGSVRPTDLRALVIGDPPTMLQRLSGAREEARTVAALLSDRQWDVKTQISEAGDSAGDTWLDIDNLLHAAPYRVVHIAAHGLYDTDEPMRSGVVTGPGPHHRLTTLDFRSMSVQPDLVFLNCCHLGLLAASDGEKHLDQWLNPQDLRKPHKMAATVATQLMKNGVKAVVVAGWAVDDGAAAAFANCLYESLLNAETFGDSVRKARTAAFNEHKESNTWGAYQCYGDPDFQLVVSRAAQDGPKLIVSDNQLINELQILSESASMDSGDDDGDDHIQEVAENLQQLVEGVGDRLDNPSVSLALGDAYSAVGDFKNAAEAYERCYLAPNGRGELRSIEQYANMLVREAARSAADDDRVPYEKAVQKLDAIITAIAATPERLSLLGSVYKKLAVVLSRSGKPPSNLGSSLPTTTKDALDTAKRKYHEAFEASRAERGEQFDVYTANVWLQLEYAGSPPDRDRGEHFDLGRQLLARAQATAETAQNFWDRSQLGDALLTTALLLNDQGGDELIREARDTYIEAFRLRSTLRERDSVRTHLDELIAIFSDLPRDQAPGLELIRELRRGIG